MGILDNFEAYFDLGDIKDLDLTEEIDVFETQKDFE
jgi:hypothetical protein